MTEYEPAHFQLWNTFGQLGLRPWRLSDKTRALGVGNEGLPVVIRQITAGLRAAAYDSYRPPLLALVVACQFHERRVRHSADSRSSRWGGGQESWFSVR